MDAMIALDFTYSQQDCLRAWRLHFKEKLNLPLDFAAIAVLVVLGLWQWRAEGPTVLVVAALASAGALGLLIAAAVYFVPLMAYRRDEKRKRPYHLCFSEDGIEFKTDNLSSQLGWQMYTNALVDRNSYLLYYGKEQFTIIPKHVLPGDRHREFDELVQAKIPAVIRR